MVLGTKNKKGSKLTCENLKFNSTLKCNLFHCFIIMNSQIYFKHKIVNKLKIVMGPMHCKIYQINGENANE